MRSAWVSTALYPQAPAQLPFPINDLQSTSGPVLPSGETAGVERWSTAWTPKRKADC
ncbi:MAG TPA: hypothetical protein VFJ16_08340 [Longimicrobium sp.]|nr:hypothetical protein [Longimicrobium sp.]